MPRGLALIILSSGLVLGQQAGAPLPPWTPGTLDIHQIQTGRGNAAFMVLPDGTTLLLDAGAVPDRESLELGPRRPNASRSPAAWIAEYVRRFGPEHQPLVSYAVVTHYHDDHMGAMPELAGQIQIKTLIDRGDQPAPPPYPAVVQEYLSRRKSFAGQVEVLRPGRADQIVLRNHPAQYPTFMIRNVAANGVVWTGRGSLAVNHFPADWRRLPARMQPGENDFSLALLIQYGAFEYFTGGDLAGVLLDDLPAWRDLESPVARAIGQVEVAVLNHHGWLDTTNAYFLKALSPQAVVIPAWHATHPDHAVVRRLRSPSWQPKPPDVFVTSLLPATQAMLSYLREPFRSTEGHVVVRVTPNGASYQVITLSDEEETATVRAVFGPYHSRK